MLDYKTCVGIGILAFLIASLIFRGKRGYRIPVWSIMALAAFITVMSGLVGLEEMEFVIDIDVVLFLIGMFSLVGWQSPPVCSRWYPYGSYLGSKGATA